MKYKEIIDKMLTEVQVIAREYPTATRIADMLECEKILKEKAATDADEYKLKQASEVTSEIFTIVDGDQELTRTIKNSLITKVCYRADNEAEWVCITKQIECDQWGVCRCAWDFTFEADSLKVRIENAKAGELKVEYDKGNFTDYTLVNYNDVANTNAPDWLDSTFHPLLYLYATYKYAGYFKPERRKDMKDRYDDLYDKYEVYCMRRKKMNRKLNNVIPDNYR